MSNVTKVTTKENTAKEHTANDFVYFLVSLCLFVVMALLTTDTSSYTNR
ncbi:MAG: hypothetical protein KF832_25640 [Caldilineaceae bacterium]|nr:hypothetical protein [Caldilineaceae bacterium]